MEKIKYFKHDSEVKRIRNCNNKTIVEFKDGQISLYPETFQEHILEVGSVYSKETLNNIKRIDDLKSINEYANKLENGRLFTEFQLREKIMKRFKTLPYKTLKEAIENLKGQKLIDDEGYCLEYYEIMSKKNIGWQRIIDELHYKKFADSKAIEALVYDGKNELKKAKNYLKKVNYKFEKCDSISRYRRVKDCLISRGFCGDVISQILSDFQLSNVNSDI